jgi:uncharacterized protein
MRKESDGMSKPELNAVSASTDTSLAVRIAALDWKSLACELDRHGCVVLPNVLTPKECHTIAALYRDDSRFRSSIDMAQHSFGEGEYRCFNCPLPELLERLRAVLYPHLVGLANLCNERMGIDQRYPDAYAAYLEQCHRGGQTQHLLRFVPGVRQDMGGDLVSPIQVAILRIHSPGRHAIGIVFVDAE